MKSLHLLTHVLSVASVLAISSIPLDQRYHPEIYVESVHSSGEFAKMHLPEPLITRNYLGDTDNVALAGNIFQVTTNIKVGSQTFTVQVDTGSTLMAIPYHSCSGCERSPHPALSSSPSAEIGCSDARCTEQACQTNTRTCGFEVTYVDQSSINGLVLSQTVSIGDLSANNVLFGAITEATANFEAPVADGIIGFAYNSSEVTCSPNCVAPVFDYLVAANGISNVFSLFLDYNDAGTLTLGGVDESLFTGEITYIPVTRTAFYAVALLAIQVDGVNVVTDTTKFGQTIIDSGTSLTFLPADVYNTMKSYFQTNYPDLPLVTGSNNLWKGSNMCFLRQSYIDLFPPIQFVFNGLTIRMPPSNYLYQSQSSDGTTIFCLGFSSSTSRQTILGDTFMRGLYVVFDRENDQVGFAATTAHPSATSSHGNGNSAPAAATLSAALGLAALSAILL